MKFDSFFSALSALSEKVPLESEPAFIYELRGELDLLSEEEDCKGQD